MHKPEKKNSYENPGQQGQLSGTYCEFGHFEQPLVVDNSTNNYSNTLFIGNLGHVLRDCAQ